MSDLVLLHGALGSAHQLESLAKDLGEARIMEFVGHGSLPDIDEPWTMNLFVDQLEEFLDGPSVIYGYSMGGYVAIELSKRRPDLVTKVLTTGTKLNWSSEVAKSEVAKLDPDVIQQKVPHFAEDLARRHGKDHWKTVLKKTGDMMIHLGNDPLLTPASMTSVSIPVMYMIGDRDEMVTLEETIEFYRATPNAQLAVLHNTRHPIEKVRKDMLAWYIDDFLRKS